MTAIEKNKLFFGSINSLSETIPWTTGLSSIMEHFLWDTKSILGISKTQLIKLIIQWSSEQEMVKLSAEDKYIQIQIKLQALIQESESSSKYANSRKGYCSPREALRRNKYFSEDYLNKEFDIFLNLCSNKYLDTLYSLITEFKTGNTWSTHGNSNIYNSSINIQKMQMDNLAYNGSSRILIANELKLGGKKNKDQILKYCYMYNILVEKKFIHEDSKFILLFIGDKYENLDLHDELSKEYSYAKSQQKLAYLFSNDILQISKKIILKSITWKDLIYINENYLEKNNTICEVEQKLLSGFNQALEEKAFLQ